MLIYKNRKWKIKDIIKHKVNCNNNPKSRKNIEISKNNKKGNLTYEHIYTWGTNFCPPKVRVL